MTETQADHLLRAKGLLGLGVLMFAIGQSLTFIIVAPLARKVGFDPQSFGIALTLASVPLIFGAPFWGRRSDVVGRKPVFIIGVAGSALGTLLVALVLQAALNGWIAGFTLLALFALARTSYGAVASAIYPAATAYMVDVTDVSNRSQGLAIMGAANGMGSVLGPVLAGLLAYFGALVPMYVAVVIGLAGGVMAFFLLPEPVRHAHQQASVKLRANDPRLRPFMLMWLVFFLTFIALQLTLAFFLQDEHGISDPKELVRTSSLLLISMAAMIVIVQIGVLQVFRVRPQVLLKILGPLFVLALVIIGLAPGVGVMALGFAVLGASFACANPGINGSASLCVEPWEQGAAAGFLSAGTTVGAILGPLIGTQLYTHLGHHAVMWGGALALGAISLYALTIRVPERGRGAGASGAAPAPEPAGAD